MFAVVALLFVRTNNNLNLTDVEFILYTVFVFYEECIHTNCVFVGGFDAMWIWEFLLVEFALMSWYSA